MIYIKIKFKNGSKLENIESKDGKRSNSMIIKFREWETTTPENSEEVMKKQILYYQKLWLKILAKIGR